MKSLKSNSLLLRTAIATFLLFVWSNQIQAQVTEMGFNLGLVGNRYTVSTNNIGQDVLLRQGNIRISPRIGAQLEYGGPKDQNVGYISLKHALLIESSVCRCGGNTEILLIGQGEDNQVNTLKYTTYQADVSVFYMAKLGGFRFFGGPSFTYNFYRGVHSSLLGGEKTTAKDQLKDYYLGGELGLGMRKRKFMYSARYHTALTPFSISSVDVPATYNIHQIRIVFSYFMFERSTGKNWGSIYKR